MSFFGIDNHLFNTTIQLQRRDSTRNSVGDYSQTLNTLLTDVPGIIQSLADNEDRVSYSQGKEYKIHAKAYIPNNLSTMPVDGDYILDNSSGILYQIVSVSVYRVARADIMSGNHIKLLLYIPQGNKS